MEIVNPRWWQLGRWWAYWRSKTKGEITCAGKKYRVMAVER